VEASSKNEAMIIKFALSFSFFFPEIRIESFGFYLHRLPINNSFSFLYNELLVSFRSLVQANSFSTLIFLKIKSPIVFLSEIFHSKIGGESGD